MLGIFVYYLLWQKVSFSNKSMQVPKPPNSEAHSNGTPKPSCMCIFFLTQAFTQGTVYCRAQVMLVLLFFSTIELFMLFKSGKEKCISSCPCFL